MSKSSRRAEAGRSKVTPATEDSVQSAAERIGPLVHNAADRVGPLVQQAADRVAPLAEAAAEAIGSAATRISPLAHSAAERLAPYASQASARVSPYASQAAGFVSPYAHQAAGFVSPYAHQAAEIVSPYASQAAERFGPLADTAKQRGTQAAQDARGKMSDTVLPRISGALSAAAASPAAIEAVRRRDAALAAIRGEQELPDTKKKRKGGWLRRLALFAALGGIAVVVARKFLGGSDADWQAARPTTPYSPPPTQSDSAATAPAETQDPESQKSVAEDSATVADAEDDPQAGSSAHEESFEANGATAPKQPAEGGDASDDEDEDDQPSMVDPIDLTSDPVAAGWVSDPDPDLTVIPADPLSADTSSEPSDRSGDETSDQSGAVGSDAKPAKWSGEGVYVGAEPPEGFTIKGNERSMKYHLPESSGYGRTIAEVWFNSEQAAQGAGFIRAQR